MKMVVSCAKTKSDTFEILCWVNCFEVQCLVILESAAFASISSNRGRNGKEKQEGGKEEKCFNLQSVKLINFLSFFQIL